MNGKTRDFCDARAILNEKTRHSHGRDSENHVKMHSNVTSSSENHVKMHTTNPTRVQIQGAVKAPIASQNPAKPAEPSKTFQTILKTSNTTQSLTKPCKASSSKNKWQVNGKTPDFCDVRVFLNEKIRHSHKWFSANPVKIH